MVRKIHVAGVAVAVLMAGAGLARAGMIGVTSVAFNNDTTINPVDPNTEYANTYHTLDWSVTNGAGAISLSDHETSITPDSSNYALMVNGDPPATLSTLVINNSGLPWIAYDVTVTSLSPGVTVTFTGTPTSTPAWLDPVMVSPDTIEYSGVITNTPLVNGGMDTLVYTLNIVPPVGYSGSISYSITSTPTVESGGGVPEPATLGLLALGALGLVLRRRRSA